MVSCAGWLLRATFLLVVAGFSTSGLAQPYTYTHTSSQDGFSWPTGSLEDSFTYPTPDGVGYYNASGSDTYFDSSYTAVGASGIIDGDAWWGEPDGGQVLLDFYDTAEGGVDSLAFDFAWAAENAPAFTTLFLEVYDIDFNSATFELDLPDSFTSGNYNGLSGRAAFNASDLFYDDGEELIPLINIHEVDIYVGDVDFEGGTAHEFAIDNVTINDTGTTGVGSFLTASPAISTRWLRGTFDPQVQVDVTNLDTGGTTFSQSLQASSNPAFQVQPPITGVPIAGGQSVSPGPVAVLGTNEPSGEYVAQVQMTNDLNSSDPDDFTSYTIWMYDPPVLTDNSSAAVAINTNPTLSIANAPPEAHAGALRAGAEVTATSVTGSGFSVVGLGVGDFVESGENELAAGAFNRFGQLTDTHTGTYSIDLKMNSEAGSFLNGAQPLPSVAWNLEFVLADTLLDSASVVVDESMAEKLGVNNSTTAATIVGGTSTAAQTVSMQFAANPGPGGSTLPLLATDVIDVAFSTPGDQYVLQFTYTEEGVPAPFGEGDLQLIYFDSTADDWRLAVNANSDSGAGAAMFTGSFEDYLASLSGSPAEQSAYGVDAANNRAWAVLDYDTAGGASVFGLGGIAAVTPLPGDFNGDGVVDAVDYAVWRENLGAGDEASLNGNGDGENGVDSGDYLLWRTSYGNTATLPATTATPEPTTLALLSLACLGIRRLRYQTNCKAKNRKDAKYTKNSQRIR